MSDDLVQRLRSVSDWYWCDRGDAMRPRFVGDPTPHEAAVEIEHLRAERDKLIRERRYALKVAWNALSHVHEERRLRQDAELRVAGKAAVVAELEGKAAAAENLATWLAEMMEAVVRPAAEMDPFGSVENAAIRDAAREFIDVMEDPSDD